MHYYLVDHLLNVNTKLCLHKELDFPEQQCNQNTPRISFGFEHLRQRCPKCDSQDISRTKNDFAWPYARWELVQDAVLQAEIFIKKLINHIFLHFYFNKIFFNLNFIVLTCMTKCLESIDPSFPIFTHSISNIVTRNVKCSDKCRCK